MAKFLNRLKLALWSSDPTTEEGEIWYNSTLDQLRYQSGSAPISVGVGTKFNDIGSNRWYMTTPGGPTTSTPITNRVYAIPFSLSRSAVLNGISAEVVVAFTTAGTVRAGLYNGDITNSPTTLIADYGTVAATVGIKTWTSMTQSLNAGSYFVAICFQGGTGGSPTFRTTIGLADQVGDVAATPAATFFNGAQNTYFSSTTQAGALGASYGTVGGSTGGPRVAIRFA